jgi:hypothetical protein
MPAPQDIERGDSNHQQTARPQHASELRRRPGFLAAREVHDHIHRQQQIERAATERQRGDIALQGTGHVQPARIFEALPTQVDRKHRPAIAFGERFGKVPGPASRLEHGVKLRLRAMGSSNRNRMRCIPRYHQKFCSERAMLANSAGFIMPIPASA